MADSGVTPRQGPLEIESEEEGEDGNRDRRRLSKDEVALVYYKGISKRPLDSWLKLCLPSQIAKQDGFDWITVVCPDKYTKMPERDVEGLMESWEHLTASDRPINFQTIKKLATKHNVTVGKWCVFASTGGKIDLFWSRIARHVVEDSSFPCRTAKVSTVVTDGPIVWNKSHVICMYTNNFCDEDEILRLEKAIRRIGIKSQLFYKPDVYTYLGIYSPKVMTNPWGLKPMLMESNFDIIQGKSIIKDLVN